MVKITLPVLHLAFSLLMKRVSFRIVAIPIYVLKGFWNTFQSFDRWLSQSGADIEVRIASFDFWVHRCGDLNIRCGNVSATPSFDDVLERKGLCRKPLYLFLCIQPFVCNANAIVVFVMWLF